MIIVKVRITASTHDLPKITDLIGHIYDVIEEESEGVWIDRSPYPNFFIWNDEFEVIQNEEYVEDESVLA